tara:strand:- start:1176 stop:1343 length:168 start_codon:yes stop_codon:yes gene_type:complete
MIHADVAWQMAASRFDAADQFANRGYGLPKVYVEPSTTWYQSFSVTPSSNQQLTD